MYYFCIILRRLQVLCVNILGHTQIVKHKTSAQYKIITAKADYTFNILHNMYIQRFTPLCFLLVLFSACNQQNSFKFERIPVSAETKATPGVNNALEEYLVLLDSTLIPSAHQRLDWATIQHRADKIKQLEQLNAQVLEQLNNWLRDHQLEEDVVLARYTTQEVGAVVLLDATTRQRLSTAREVVSIEPNRVRMLTSK